MDDMEQVERGMAGSIVARAQSLERRSKQSALIIAVVTVVILLLVLIATLAVARSLVRPLRRLKEGALNIATVQLPERVRQLGEATDSATSLEVVPIDVVSADEIGQVARAFDQVHSEAVRLAGDEAMLRNSFNAMFLSLSRRSQSLVEVGDSGVGIPEARLAEINWRLDNPPVIDVSVSRHMGLFAVGRLAERHGVRVRLQARSPHGLTAMIWLPDSVIERQARPAGWAAGQFGPRAAATTRPASGGPGTILRSAAEGPSPDDAVMPAYTAAATRETGPAAASATSDWFHSRRSSGTAGGGSNPPGAASQTGSGWRSGTEGWAESREAAPIVADPVRGDHPAAWLPKH